MLKGLEVSEVRWSETTRNKDFRIDSQFYTKAPIKNPNLEYKKIGTILEQTQYGISIEMNESNFQINPNKIELESPKIEIQRKI